MNVYCALENSSGFINLFFLFLNFLEIIKSSFGVFIKANICALIRWPGQRVRNRKN